MQQADVPDPGGRDLTPRRRMIVQVIEDSVRRNGFSPSMREIAEAVGLASTASVSYQLSKLEEQGVLSREPRRAHHQDPDGPGRAARQHDGAAPEAGNLNRGSRVARVPLVGRIAAGIPILAAELPGDVIPLPRVLVGQGRASSCSTSPATRWSARRSPTATGWSSGASLTPRTATSSPRCSRATGSADGEATVKTLEAGDGHIWLIPHNPALRPSWPTATIIGKVVAVLRRI